MARVGSVLFCLLVALVALGPREHAAAGVPPITPATTAPAITVPATTTPVPTDASLVATTPDGTTSAVAFVGIAVGAMGLGIGLLALWRGRRHDHLATIATTDGLTGLRNRRSLDDDLDRHCQHGEERTAFLMIDVDHFKAFNDAYGHAAGDDVLRAVAASIERTVRSGDVTYRYGGEEFCVLLPRTDDATASLVAERIRRAIETSHLPGEARVTISVGVAAGRAGEVAALIARADGALYAAKDGGRNRIAVG